MLDAAERGNVLLGGWAISHESLGGPEQNRLDDALNNFRKTKEKKRRED
jgi:hypothetical protein